MIEKDIKITNRLGLHARAASAFVQKAEQFSSKVEIEKDGVRINAKSIMGILILAAPVNTEIKIIVSGEDEKMCMETLIELVENKFGEEE
ncbi:MAG: HPr family phosphocarrier protein [bacterium]